MPTSTDVAGTPGTRGRLVAKSESRLALESVFALLGRPLGQDTTTPTTNTVLPSARARAALEEFAQCKTIEELNDKRLNLKVLSKDLFDWHGDTNTRATGSVVKAVARALLAVDENDVSLFPQAVEMLGFASAAAPLLQPDRLARLIDESSKVATAFAPDRYTMRLSGALRTVLGRYPDQRRETMLVSLWHAAHTGRWWDVTSGITKIVEPRRRNEDPEHAAQADAQTETVRAALNGSARGTIEAHDAVAKALLEENLPYNPGTAELVAELPPLQMLRDGMAQASEDMRAGKPVYPDKALLLSQIRWAAPEERPESPIAWLVRILITAMEPDPETGEALLSELPAKPKRWIELYPEADVTGFPHPPQARSLDGKTFEGTAVVVEVVKNAAELAANRDYMGNCTYSYKNRMEAGAYVLLRLWDGPNLYNGSIVADQPGAQWRVGEVNSRHNRGGVPNHIRVVVGAIAAGLPPRMQPSERIALETRRYRANL